MSVDSIDSSKIDKNAEHGIQSEANSLNKPVDTIGSVKPTVPTTYVPVSSIGYIVDNIPMISTHTPSMTPTSDGLPIDQFDDDKLIPPTSDEELLKVFFVFTRFYQHFN